jgi:hypothetical protein
MPQPVRDINAESLREIGILLAVFGPLEALLKGASPHAVDFIIASAILATGGVSLVLGTRMGKD